MIVTMISSTVREVAKTIEDPAVCRLAKRIRQTAGEALAFPKPTPVLESAGDCLMVCTFALLSIGVLGSWTLFALLALVATKSNNLQALSILAPLLLIYAFGGRLMIASLWKTWLNTRCNLASQSTKQKRQTIGLSSGIVFAICAATAWVYLG
jgi:hypothetical protein